MSAHRTASRHQRLRNRKLRLESLESRNLLSIHPIAAAISQLTAGSGQAAIVGSANPAGVEAAAEKSGGVGAAKGNDDYGNTIGTAYALALSSTGSRVDHGQDQLRGGPGRVFGGCQRHGDDDRDDHRWLGQDRGGSTTDGRGRERHSAGLQQCRTGEQDDFRLGQRDGREHVLHPGGRRGFLDGQLHGASEPGTPATAADHPAQLPARLQRLYRRGRGHRAGGRHQRRPSRGCAAAPTRPTR